MAITNGFQVFSQLFAQVDRVTESFVTQVSSHAITAVMPVVSGGGVIMFVIYGLMIAHGRVEMPFTDFILKSAKIAAIVALAGAGGYYQSRIANVIVDTPSELAYALIPQSQYVNSTDATNTDAAAALLDKAMSDGFQAGTKAWQKIGWRFSSAWLLVAGAVIIFTTAALGVVGGAFIILAKVALAILAGLGPIFILALIFKPMQRFFEAWVGQVLSFGLLIVMQSAVFGFFIHLFDNFVSGINYTGVLNMGETLGGAIIIGFAGIVLMVQIPGIASSLGGGLALDVWGAASRAATGSRGAADMATTGGSAAVSGAVRGVEATSSAALHPQAAAQAVTKKAVGYFRGG